MYPTRGRWSFFGFMPFPQKFFASPLLDAQLCQKPAILTRFVAVLSGKSVGQGCVRTLLAKKEAETFVSHKSIRRVAR